MSADRATRHYQYGGSPANWAFDRRPHRLHRGYRRCNGRAKLDYLHHGCRLSCAGWSRHPGDARYGLRRGSLNAAHCYRNGP